MLYSRVIVVEVFEAFSWIVVVFSLYFLWIEQRCSGSTYRDICLYVSFESNHLILTFTDWYLSFPYSVVTGDVVISI